MEVSNWKTPRLNPKHCARFNCKSDQSDDGTDKLHENPSTAAPRTPLKLTAATTPRTPAQAPISSTAISTPGHEQSVQFQGEERGTIDWIDPCKEWNGKTKAYRRGEGGGGGGIMT